MTETNEKIGKLSLLKSLFEQRDSIRVSRTTTGKFSFEVKRYYDFDKTKPEVIIEQIKGIYEKLESCFSNG